MKELIGLSNNEARDFFLTGDSYFNSDLPPYMSFEPILSEVANQLDGICYPDYRTKRGLASQNCSNVNYLILTNKDGKFDWRPLELIHPLIYVSLVNLLCEPENWKKVINRWSDFQGGHVDCCSGIVIPEGDEKTKAAQVKKWWDRVEQQSLRYSLEFSHVLHTDITNCYGSLYTHSIAWAIHGYIVAKENRHDCKYLGNHLDKLIGAGRDGQTNGIAQGSVLMDFIAEIVLGYVDEQINIELAGKHGCKILRYRDDYRIFADSDDACEKVLQIISKELLKVGMKLGSAKTNLCRNVVEGSIKPDKLAGLDLHGLETLQTKTIQKQLLMLHSFGQRFPNSGALKRLVSEYQIIMHNKFKKKPKDLDVLVAIATDIGFTSPGTFPAISAILSKLISLAPAKNKPQLWEKVRGKMARVPNNGYLEIWLQRVILPKTIDLTFSSNETICKIVDRKPVDIWNNNWIDDPEIKKSVDPSKFLIKDPREIDEVVDPSEIELFRQNAWFS